MPSLVTKTHLHGSTEKKFAPPLVVLMNFLFPPV
jgi:hypothetical protein